MRMLGIKFLISGTVTLLLALVRFSIAADILRRNSPTTYLTVSRPEQKGSRAECIKQKEIFPAYRLNSKANVSGLSRKSINVLVVDLHDGMRREMASVAKRVLSDEFDMSVRVLVPESSARWCDFRGLDWWTMCGSEEVEAFLKRAPDVSWVAEADLIMFSLPPVLLQLLRPLGKPMVVWITVPPEYGRQNTEAYMDWLSDFRSAANDPSIAIVSASRYDQMYVRYFYGVDTEVIGLSSPGIRSDEQSHEHVDEEGNREKRLRHRKHANRHKHKHPTCSRRSGCVSSDRASLASGAAATTEATTTKANTSTSIGLFPKSCWKLSWAGDLFSSSLADLNVSFVDPGALEQYHAAIYLPYMRNTNLFLEIYRSGIPILTPSLDFLVRLDQAYCLMSNRVYWTRTPQPCDRIYPHSPNDLRYSSFPSERAPEAHAFWLGHSEHFSPSYPGIIYFDSEKDLREKLFRVDLEESQDAMDRQNRRETRKNTESWVGVFSSLLAALPDMESKPQNKRSSAFFGSKSSKAGIDFFNGTCAPETRMKSFHDARTQINRRCKVIEIDWDGFPARHSCDTWYDLYGYWPGGP